MPRPNPKTYPFNYLVHEGNDSKNFATFVEADDYVRTTYPDGVHEELWSTDEGSKLKRLPWREFDDPHKYVWQSAIAVEQFARLNNHFVAGNLQAAKQFLIEEVGDEIGGEEFEEFDQLAAFVMGHTYCSIERRRDAYEAAMKEWEAAET